MPKIEFCFEGDGNNIFPSPAKKFIPEWYKKDSSSIALKRCMPFIDGYMSGYMATTTEDILVEQKENTPFIKNSKTVSYREMSSVGNMEIPTGCSKKQFLWNYPYIIKTPQNYSVFIMHPVNRYELPFITLSAVVDSDSIMPKGYIPFFLKEGFSGLIPSGTPIFQIFPFLRENWESENNTNLIKESYERNNRYQEDNFYKKHYWNYKKYE